jgi:hypothetical protein
VVVEDDDGSGCACVVEEFFWQEDEHSTRSCFSLRTAERMVFSLPPRNRQPLSMTMPTLLPLSLADCGACVLSMPSLRFVRGKAEAEAFFVELCFLRTSSS